MWRAPVVTFRVELARAAALVAILTVLCAADNAALAGSYGTESPFSAGTGGRVSALGLAGASLTGDPSLQQFNPATLSELQYQKLELFRTTFFDSKSLYHSVSYGYPMLNYGTLAATILRLDVGGIEERDLNNILLTADLKNAETRLLLGYAATLHSALSAGINLKVDNQSFGAYSGSGIGLDLGFLSTKEFAEGSRLRLLRGGLSIVNLIEPSLKLDQEDVADPMSVIFGGSAVASAGQIEFVTLVDFVVPRYSPFQVRFGQEVGYGDILAFRVGFDGSTPTVGGGVSWRGVAVDYAFRSEDLGSNHRFSVTVRFGSSLEARREDRRRAREAELDRQISEKMSALESTQLSRTIARADSLFGEARYGEAATQYELALLWDSDNQRTRPRLETCRYYQAMGRAQALISEQQYLEALYQLRMALAHSPNDPEATSLIEECNTRIRAHEDHAEMIERMMKQSIDLYASRRFVESNAGFREILNLDPENKLAKEYEQKSYTNIQNQKQSAVVEANGLVDKAEYAAAVSVLERALRLDPGDDHLRNRIKELQARQSQADRLRERESKDTPVQVPPARPTADAGVLQPKYSEGLEAFEKGDFDGAVRRLHEVWLVDPGYHNVTELLTKAYLFIGMKQYSEEDYQQAIVTWERALIVDPDNLKAKRYLRKAREEANRLSSVNDG
jgi:tetratricopeptide (TPR) repeat protein